MNGQGKLKILSKKCDRSLIGNYSGWIERRYSSNSFITDRSPTFQITLTDPCPYAVFSPDQSFFEPNSYPYFYLLGDSVIQFNITKGYSQDNESIAAGVEFYCGYPTFSFRVKNYPNWNPASSNQVQWL